MKQYDFVSETDENGKTVVSVANAPKRRKVDIIPLIVCFFISLGVWIYMVNLNDTDVTATFTIPIEIEGIDELQSRQDMMLYGVDTSEIVITVKGSNRDLRRFSQSDYRATINVGDISSAGRHSRTVNVSVPTGSTITLDMKELVSVNFYTDLKVTKEIPFDFLEGHWITNPTYVYEIEKSAEHVSVTGPKSIIDSIDTARFLIPDGEYYTSKNFIGFALSFFDAEGESIVYDSSVVTYSTADVSVMIIVTMQKPVTIDIKLPEGVSGIEAIPSIDSVDVKGDPAVISSVGKYTVVLSEEDIASGESITVTLVDDNLPSGVTLVNPEQSLKISFIAVSTESDTTEDAMSSSATEMTETVNGTATDSAEATTESGETDFTEEEGGEREESSADSRDEMTEQTSAEGEEVES